MRNDIISIIESYARYSSDFKIDLIHRFLERLLEYLHNQDYYEYSLTDHYKFFTYELFLYVGSILLNESKYVELAFLLDKKYYITTKQEGFVNKGFNWFNQYMESLDSQRNSRLNLRRKSVSADLIKQKEFDSNWFQRLLETDVILYYAYCFRLASSALEHDYNWFPQTSVYGIQNLPIFARSESSGHFNTVVCPILGVSTVNELEKLTEVIEESNLDDAPRYSYSFPRVANYLKSFNIGKSK